MRIEIRMDGVEDIIYAIDGILDATESAKANLDGKPFPFESLKKVINTFREKVERYERQKPDEKKPGSFSEFLDEKKADKKSVADAIDEVGEDYKPPENQFNPDEFLETELGKSLRAYVNEWAESVVQSDKNSAENILVAMHEEYFKIYQIALQQFYEISIQLTYRVPDDGMGLIGNIYYNTDKSENKRILFGVYR